jgi:hypothetical protein
MSKYKYEYGNYELAPEHILDSINRYAEKRVPTGGFIRACLENNLSEALCRADKACLVGLKDIMMYIYWEIPSVAWGSEDKVKEWLKREM